jgi:PAS domain S-box-containing protein
MSSQSSPNSNLLKEISELRQRLNEAEDTLRAIRGGEVDALVIESHEGPQIYTLQGLDAELNRFRGEILEQISEAVIVLDETQNVIYLNGTTERQYGVCASTVIGCHVSKIFQRHWIQPNDKAEKIKILQETGHWRGENIHVRNNGSTIHVESQVTRIKTIHGAQSGELIVIRDITERKHAEESIKKSQTQRRLFIQQAPISIAMFDREMNYLVASDRWVDEFGQACDSLIGGNYYALHPNIPERWKEIHRKALTGEFLRNDEDLWIKMDGSQQWLRWVAYPWTNDDGEIGGIIISCEDITARHIADDELLTAQTRLSLILEEVKACYWDWDLSSGRIYASPEWKRQMDFSEDESINTWEEWLKRVHLEDKSLVLKAKEDCIVSSKPNFEVQYRIQHKDNSYHYIHSRGALLRDLQGNPYRILGINLDISEYMKTKELKEQRDEIEKSTQLYVASQTAAAIAHELNQPLTALTFYSFVAKKLLDSGNSDPQKLTDIIEKCGQQAKRAADVIKHLMVFLHKGVISSESVDIHKLITYSLDYVKANEDLSTVTIKLNLSDNLQRVHANALQVQKVIINLIMNALESMEGNKKNNKSMTIIARPSPNEPNMAQVSVFDNGKGVSDIDTLSKIFQAFYTTKPTGLGMGLAISRALIETHGGKMWAEQNADAGLCVHFTLPFVS